MNKKYELIATEDIRFFRIKALRSFGAVKAGDLGGLIERENNLSHDGDAWVFGNARVYGDARVSGNARVYGDAWLSGDARVSGNASVYGNAWLSGDARVYGDGDLLWIGGVGSERATLTAYLTMDDTIEIARGCFRGSIDEFSSAVERTHGDNEYGREYRALMEYLKVRIRK